MNFTSSTSMKCSLEFIESPDSLDQSFSAEIERDYEDKIEFIMILNSFSRQYDRITTLENLKN